MVKRLLIINFILFFVAPYGSQLQEMMALSRDGLFSFQIYQLVTYQFMHGGFGHIFGNMILLFFLGPELEQRWGSKNFITVYIGAGVVAGLAEVVLTSNPYAAIVGASGSVMAVFTAYTLYYPNREILLYFLFPIKIKYLFLFYLISDLAGVMPSAAGDGIAHFAHLGGVLVGFLYARHANSYIGHGRSWDSGQNQSGDIFGKMKDAFESVKKKEPSFTSSHRDDSFDRDKLRYYRNEVDSLLDKINSVGYLNLSDDERRRLEDASAYLKRYDLN